MKGKGGRYCKDDETKLTATRKGEGEEGRLGDARLVE